MFFPLHLAPTPYQEVLYNQLVQWCGNQEKLIYISAALTSQATSVDTLAEVAKTNQLVERSLTKAELATVATYLQQVAEASGQNLQFGGFVIGQELTDIHSLAIFSLNPAREEARLILFVANPTPRWEASPLQSPLLLLAIAALIRQEKAIERLYLPFSEVWQEDFISLALYNFAPSAEQEPGWWQQVNTQAALAELLIYPPSEALNAKWLEVKLEVEAALVDYVSRLFSRYSYQQRFLLEQPELAEAPAILRAYLPAGAEATHRIKQLSQQLVGLNQLRPIAALQFIERDMTYWQALWNAPNLFRVNSHILLTPDRKNFRPAPGEILIEIPASVTVFASNEDGPHVTTGFCLQLLAKYLDPLRHANLLDLGTGGGTLAIVASYLGATRILALDAFAPAIEVARANVLQNGVASQVLVEAGSLAVLIKKDSLVYSFTVAAQQPPAVLAERMPFDMITSNTFYHVLIGQAPALYNALRPGGLLISGGIFKQKAGEVAAAFLKAGFELCDRLEDENWVSFAHSRPA